MRIIKRAFLLLILCINSLSAAGFGQVGPPEELTLVELFPNNGDTFHNRELIVPLGQVDIENRELEIKHYEADLLILRWNPALVVTEPDGSTSTGGYETYQTIQGEERLVGFNDTQRLDANPPVGAIQARHSMSRGAGLALPDYYHLGRYQVQLRVRVWGLIEGAGGMIDIGNGPRRTHTFTHAFEIIQYKDPNGQGPDDSLPK